AATLPLLDLHDHDLHVRSLALDPLFQSLHETPGVDAAGTDRHETECGSSLDVLQIDLGGRYIEGLSGPRQQTLDDLPFLLQGATGKIQFNACGANVHEYHRIRRMYVGPEAHNVALR